LPFKPDPLEDTVKRLILLLVSLAFVTALVGCPKQYVVRDSTVYQTELNQYDAWAVNQAALLKGFMESGCLCDDAQVFETKECRDSADYVLTIGARAPWHKAMALYNASITTERPPEVPPEIPPSSSLCPELPPTMVPVAAPVPDLTPTTPEGGE